MSRPTNKKELIELSKNNFSKLLELINSLPDDLKTKSFENNELNLRDKTISDCVCHLHEWHLMMANWYKIGMNGGKPIMPGEGYTWKTLPAFNHLIYEKYKGTKLEEAISMLQTSHKEIMILIENHTNEELFTKQKYKWTGTTSLAAYLISATSSHYDWGIKQIKPLKKKHNL